MKNLRVWMVLAAMAACLSTVLLTKEDSPWRWASFGGALAIGGVSYWITHRNGADYQAVQGPGAPTLGGQAPAQQYDEAQRKTRGY